MERKAYHEETFQGLSKETMIATQLPPNKNDGSTQWSFKERDFFHFESLIIEP